MIKECGKKGLSTIVATLLIILLTLVAVGIIWIVVRNVIQGGSEQISLGKFTLDLKISQVQKINDSALSVTIKRNAGEGDFVGISFVVEDDTGTEVVKQNVSMSELQTKTFQLYFITINTSRLKKISIAPIFRLESGKEVNGDVKDTYFVESSGSGITTCTPSCPTGAVCGSDGCGGSCGTCSNLSLPNCVNYQCSAQVCTPSCVGRVCGSDGCTGSCGTCGTGQTCTNYVCVDNQVPAPTQTFLRTFYVNATTGNDANDGRNPTNAWKTIAKVNSATFLPGDGILFERGQVWRETLAIPSSGNATHYITFGNYGGNVNKPKILGSEKAISWILVGGFTNIWNASGIMVGDPYNLRESYLVGPNYWSDIFFVEGNGSVSWSNQKQNVTSANFSNLTKEYDWSWNLNFTYIYSVNNPNTWFNSVEVPQRARAIFVDNKENITIDGLELQFAYSRTIQTEYPQKNTTGLIIRNCDISYVGSRVFETGYHLAILRSNMIIQNNEVHDGGRRDTSFHLYGTSATQGIRISNITIEKNNFHNGYHSTGVGLICNQPNNIIENAIIRNNLIWDPVMRNASADGLSPNEMCSIKDESAGFACTVRNIQVYNNIFMHVTQSGVWLDGVDNVSIYHNTFYDFNPNLLPPYQAQSIKVSNDCNNITIKNNILYGTGNRTLNGGLNNLYISYSQNASKVFVDYNLFYQKDNMMIIVQDGATGYRTTSWNLIKGSPLYWQIHEPGLLLPGFVNADLGDNPNLHLNSTSPAINAGTDVGITTDYDGHVRDSSPDIGAYEYP
jgi:hypothetical protein